jgi:hypothetical protein
MEEIACFEGQNFLFVGLFTRSLWRHRDKYIVVFPKILIYSAVEFAQFLVIKTRIWIRIGLNC